MLPGCCTVSSCQSIAKQLLRCSGLLLTGPYQKKALYQVSVFRHAERMWFFFLQSFFFFLKSNKIQELLCLHTHFVSFTHFHFLFLLIGNYVTFIKNSSFGSSWSMLIPCCFLKKSLCAYIYIIAITDTLDIDDTAWNRFYHLIVRTVSPKDAKDLKSMMFWSWL